MIKRLEIPNLCLNSSLLFITMMTQLLIFIVWLINFSSVNWNDFLIWSLYGQWSVIIHCLVFCLFRNYIAKKSFLQGVLITLLLSNLLMLSIELTSQLLTNAYDSDSINVNRLFRQLLISNLLCLLAIRFFLLIDQLNARSKCEAESRVLALQSRIQPHFLFNSLNTISELTQADPQQAEQAIHSLSILFRASLENEKKHHSLENEFTLCERYLELERWRLGDRLKVNWSKNVEQSARWRVPKLLIQPLCENAIVHGKLDNGDVNISIDTRESRHHISIMIENDKSKSSSASSGNGIALDNIRERLQVLYDDQQTFRVKESATKYSVLVRVPKREV